MAVDPPMETRSGSIVKEINRIRENGFILESGMTIEVLVLGV